MKCPLKVSVLKDDYVGFRLSASLKTVLSELAEREGLSLSKFLHKMAVEKAVSEGVSLMVIAEIVE